MDETIGPGFDAPPMRLARQSWVSELELKRWRSAYRTWRLEQVAINQLSSLSDRQLKDIGSIARRSYAPLEIVHGLGPLSYLPNGQVQEFVKRVTYDDPFPRQSFTRIT